MKILIDKKRYSKRIVFLLLSGLAFGAGAVLVLVMNEPTFAPIFWGSILGIMAAVSFMNLVFYISIRKLEVGFVYENGAFYDYSKPFSKAHGIKAEDMKSITNWSERMGINQYIMVKKGFGLGGNPTVHRLKGNHIYFSDYIVDPEALKEMIQLMQSEQTPEGQTTVEQTKGEQSAESLTNF
jgi:hypothetical protein